jgi:hypothetical protein
MKRNHWPRWRWYTTEVKPNLVSAPPRTFSRSVMTAYCTRCFIFFLITYSSLATITVLHIRQHKLIHAFILRSCQPSFLFTVYDFQSAPRDGFHDTLTDLFAQQLETWSPVTHRCCCHMDLLATEVHCRWPRHTSQSHAFQPRKLSCTTTRM